MSDEEKRWMLLIFPQLGEIVAWLDPELMRSEGWIDAENATRIMIDPRTGNGQLVKMGENGVIPLNLAMLITYRPAPFVLVGDVSKLWDRIVVPEKRILPHD